MGKAEELMQIVESALSGYRKNWKEPSAVRTVEGVKEQIVEALKGKDPTVVLERIVVILGDGNRVEEVEVSIRKPQPDLVGGVYLTI